MFRVMLGGWLDLLCTYRGVVAGFENVLNLPVVRYRRRIYIYIYIIYILFYLFIYLFVYLFVNFFFPGPSLIAAFYAEEITLAKQHLFYYYDICIIRTVYTEHEDSL